MRLPKRIILDVHQADIDQGLRANGRRCPLALALGRWLDEHNISYNQQWTAVSTGTGWVEVNPTVDQFGQPWSDIGAYHLSKPAQRWVRTFDQEGHDAVKPARFYITLVRSYERVLNEEAPQ